MCYSPKVSLIAFFTNLIGCIILYYYNPILSLFFIYVSLMQLYDYIFWTNLGENKINYYFTQIAMITNHLQPIILALLILYFQKKIKKTSVIMLGIYVASILIYTFINYKNIKYTLVTKDSNNSLFWAWNYGFGRRIIYLIFLLTLCILFIQHLEMPINYIMAIVSVLSILFAWYKFKGMTIGRFWCYLASFLPLLFVLCYYIKNNYF